MSTRKRAAPAPAARGTPGHASRARAVSRDGAALTATPLLARNVTLNLAGWVFPALLALVAIPILSRRLGVERFGVLNLAWTAVGYFALLDLGLGRAVTQLLSTRIGRGKSSSAAPIAWTALALLAPFACATALGVWLGAEWIARDLLDVPPELERESVHTARLVAVAIPAILITAVARGMLEAAQRFGVINALRLPLALLTFGAPLATLPFTQSVAAALGALVVGRLILCVAHVRACLTTFPPVARPQAPSGVVARRLLRVGGWLTVSNVVNPILVSADRVVAGAALGVGALGFYATPHEIATKMWLFTGALLPVLFPAFAITFDADVARTRLLFDRAARATWLALFPPALVFALFADELLTAWVGEAFAREGARVLQILAIAVFCNSVGQSAYTALQAAGHPRATALSHLAQLPPFLVALAWATPRYGIVGVAAVWGGRVLIDSAVTFASVVALLPALRDAAVRAAVYTAAGGVALSAATIPGSPAGKGTFLAAAAAAYVAFAWTRCLTPSERSFVRGRLRLTGA